MAVVEKMGADAVFIPALDEIAWTLNLRGEDVAFTPVVISYLYLSDKENVLFIDSAKVDDAVKAHLKEAGVKIKGYDDVEDYLGMVAVNTTVLLDPNIVSDTLARALECYKVYGKSPVSLLKAIKNDVQIAGTRKAMERDGAALVRLFKWLEENVASGNYNECDVGGLR